jgi:hypothetical protein
MSIISSTQERQLILAQHKVIPDALPYGLDLSYGLTVKWPETTLDTLAQELDREATQPEPKVYLDPAVRNAIIGIHHLSLQITQTNLNQ